MNQMNISQNAEMYLKKDAPKNIRLMAAKGAVPLVPGDLLVVLHHLLGDPDPEISHEAQKSLDTTPRAILKNALSSELPPSVLDYFSKTKKDDPEIMEILILNRMTHDDSIAEAARSGNPKLLEIISHNQERMMRSEKILNNLIENPYLSQVSRDRLLEFFTSRKSELPANKKAELPLDRKAVPPQGIKAELPQDVMAELPQDVKAELPQDVKTELPTVVNAQLPHALAAVDVPQDLLEDKKEPISENEHKNLFQKIQKMSASAKIKLALLGGKEARNILIRDPNKLVAAAVVKSPKVTESEISIVAQSRNVSDEVLRLIAANKEWMKNYQIKLALVCNPKTPLPISMRFLSSIKDGDLKQLSLSRNVSSAISIAAKRIVSGKAG